MFRRAPYRLGEDDVVTEVSSKEKTHRQRSKNELSSPDKGDVRGRGEQTGRRTFLLKSFSFVLKKYDFCPKIPQQSFQGYGRD